MSMNKVPFHRKSLASSSPRWDRNCILAGRILCIILVLQNTTPSCRLDSGNCLVPVSTMDLTMLQADSRPSLTLVRQSFMGLQMRLQHFTHLYPRRDYLMKRMDSIHTRAHQLRACRSAGVEGDGRYLIASTSALYPVSDQS
jgi:hypothetical protein